MVYQELRLQKPPHKLLNGLPTYKHLCRSVILTMSLRIDHRGGAKQFRDYTNGLFDWTLVISRWTT